MNKNRKVIIILFLVNFILGALTGGKLPYLVLIILLFVFGYSYISLIKAVKNLHHFFWISSDVAMVGDIIEIGYNLNNTGLLPIAYIETECRISKKLGGISFPKEIAFMKPFQMISIRRKIECRHRGYYELGKLEVTLRDFFHIFEKKVIFNKNMDVVVYPRIYEINHMKIPATEFFGTTRVSHNTYEDYTSLRDYRAYVEGDNVKKIHWKLSAKRDEIYVKDFELSASTKINIFLDGFSGSYDVTYREDVEEKIVETTGSIIKYCLKNSYITTLNVTSKIKTNIEGRGLDKLDGFLKELIGFIPNGTVALNEVLILESRKLSYGSTLVVITTNIKEKLFNTLVALSRKGFNLMIILNRLNKDHWKDEYDMIDYLKKIKTEIYIIELDSNIPEILEGY